MPASGRTNDLDELLTADNIGDNTLDQTFVYDPSGNGNLTSQTGLGSYTYPLSSAPQPHAPLTAGAKTFTYDANGNMVADGSRALSYDDDNRPVTVGPVVYVYGPDGKRLKKISASGTTLYLGADVELANGVWTKYLHADVKVVGTGGYLLALPIHASRVALSDRSAAVTTFEGVAFDLSGSFDGLGSSDHEDIGGKAAIRIPLN